jgi:CubicO group peptidase (beta-lactamase class C family)
LLTGVLTSRGQTYLPGSILQFANSYSVWLAVSFLIGVLLPNRTAGLIGGVAVQLMALVGYYVASFLFLGVPPGNLGIVLLWVIGGATGGPALSLGGYWWRTRHDRYAAIGSALLGAIFVSEGLYVLITLQYPIGAAFVALGVVATLVTTRQLRTFPLTLALTAAFSGTIWFSPMVLAGSTRLQRRSEARRGELCNGGADHMQVIHKLWSLLILVALVACAAPQVEQPSPAPSTTQSAATTATISPSVAPVEPVATSVAPVAAETGVADQTNDIYADPQNRFSVPIPTGWTAEQRNGFVTLSDPDDLIRSYALVIENADPEAALAEAWRLIDPAFALQPVNVQEPPPTDGIEQVIETTYDAGTEERSVTGRGQRYGGSTYVLLVDAESAALQRRAAQVEIIETGFRIEAIPVVDLRNATPARMDATIITELAAFTERMLAQFKVPGAAVAVVQAGEVVYIDGFGVRNAQTNEPLAPQTRMMIGSTGKSLTTLMMATLVDDGAMTWDTTARQILPSFAVADPALSDQITVRNLVCACTGVPRRNLELIFNANDTSAEDIIASLASFEFYTPIGEAFQYSNQMVASGGYIATVADGHTPGDLLEEYGATLKARVLDPIGMPNTTLSFAEIERSDNYAVPHTQNLAADRAYLPRPLRIEQTVTPAAPAGGQWSTAKDMANYLITQLNRGVAPDGSRVVSAENLQETSRPQVPVDARTQYGLGWFVTDYKGQPLIHHGGNTLGFTSDFAFLPEADLGVLVLSNGQGTNAMNEAIRTRLWELVFAQPAEAEAVTTFARDQTNAEFAALAMQLSDTLDGAAIAPFVGRYRNDGLGDMTITVDGNVLLLDSGEYQSHLRPLRGAADQPPTCVMIDPPFAGLTFTFANDEIGQPTMTMGGFGLEPYTFRRIE